MARRRTNEIVSNAPCEIAKLDFSRLAIIPNPKAKTGMLVKLAAAMSKEFTCTTIQVIYYRNVIAGNIVL